MTRVETIAEEVKSLSPKDLADFRQWFQDFEASEWDHQIEEDVLSGRLENLARQALAEHAAGRTRLM